MDKCNEEVRIGCAKNIQKNESRVDAIENSITSIQKATVSIKASLDLEMKMLSKGLQDLTLQMSTIMLKLEERNVRATEVAEQNRQQFDKLNVRIDEIETIVTDTKVIESKVANLEKILYAFIGLCTTIATAILFKQYM